MIPLKIIQDISKYEFYYIKRGFMFEYSFIFHYTDNEFFEGNIILKNIYHGGEAIEHIDFIENVIEDNNISEEDIQNIEEFLNDNLDIVFNKANLLK